VDNEVAKESNQRHSKTNYEGGSDTAGYKYSREVDWIVNVVLSTYLVLVVRCLLRIDAATCLGS
jgi:hypothetical protein